MKKKTMLKQSWVWSKDVVDFVNQRLEGHTLNVCAGENPMCDVNLDLDPKDKSILKGDMRLLPFDDNTFDTVVSDPPWKIGYYERFRPFFECVRVCRVGGQIIYNATWIPESRDVVLDEVWARQDGSFTTTSIISVFTKFRNDMDYSLRIIKEKAERSDQ